MDDRMFISSAQFEIKHVLWVPARKLSAMVGAVPNALEVTKPENQSCGLFCCNNFHKIWNLGKICMLQCNSLKAMQICTYMYNTKGTMKILFES